MDVKTSIFLLSKIMYNTIQGSGSMKHKILIITIMWILYGTLEEYIPILSHDLVAWIPIIITLCLIFDVYPKSLFSKTYKLEKKITKKMKEISKTLLTIMRLCDIMNTRFKGLDFLEKGARRMRNACIQPPGPTSRGLICGV